MTTKFEGNVRVEGTLTPTSLNVPAGAVTNTGIAAGANVDADKTANRQAVPFGQANGSAVVAETRAVFIARNAATIKAVEAILQTPATGDYTISVDVQKASAGVAAATILSATVDFAAADSTAYTIKAGTLSTTSLAANETLLVVVTVSGSSGSQGQGLAVTITVDENGA